MYNFFFFFFKGTKSKRTLQLQTVFDTKEGRKETKWKSALKCSFLGVHFLLIVVI